MNWNPSTRNNYWEDFENRYFLETGTELPRPQIAVDHEFDPDPGFFLSISDAASERGDHALEDHMLRRAASRNSLLACDLLTETIWNSDRPEDLQTLHECWRWAKRTLHGLNNFERCSDSDDLSMRDRREIESKAKEVIKKIEDLFPESVSWLSPTDLFGANLNYCLKCGKPRNLKTPVDICETSSHIVASQIPM